MPEARHDAGLLDTSVLIAPEGRRLPAQISVAALSLAELAAGPHATSDARERGRRQERLQAIEAMFDPLPFDAACGRAYGRIYSAIADTGRKARGRRAVDLLIAATAAANGLPLYTLNAEDLRGLESVLEIVDCGAEG